MKGGTFLPILVAGATPLALVGLIIFGSTLGLVAWKPPVFWTDQFGSPVAMSGVGAIASSNTSVYAAGYLNTNGTFVDNAYIRKYNADGATAWTSAIQDTFGFLITGISVGSDGVYALEDTGNQTLLKYDFNGKELWSQGEPGLGIVAIASTVTAVFAAGCSSHSLTTQNYTVNKNRSNCISFVREYDSKGDIVWTSEFSNSSGYSPEAWGISEGTSGVYILAPPALVAYSLDGEELWSYQFGAPGFVLPFSVSSDSTGVYVSGIVRTSTISYPTGFLTKLSLNGIMLWNAAFESPDEGGLGTISISADSSGIYISMVSGSSNDFVKKYDSSGKELWSFQTPLMSKYDNFLVAAGPGGFYLAGAIESSQGTEGLVQAFSGSSSLVFFGVNPPFSFILLGALIAVTILSILLLKSIFVKRISRRPQSASADRLRKPSKIPGD